MYQEFLKSRLFRHRLYFKTDIHLAINPDLAARGWTGECPPRPLCGGGGALWQPGHHRRPSGDILVALTTKLFGSVGLFVTGLSFGY